MNIKDIKIIQDINYNIDPLDCIVFSGTDFISKSVMCIQKCSIGQGEWSRIGIVVNKNAIPSLNVKDNELYLWESTISTTNKLISQDHINNEPSKNVFRIQIRKLKDAIQHGIKNGIKMGIAKLQNNPFLRREGESIIIYEERLIEIKNKLSKLHKENDHLRLPYKKNIYRSFLSCYRKNNCLGEEWKFCDQFVSLVYTELGIVPQNFDLEIIPQDLISKSKEGIPIIFNKIIYVCK